VSVQSSRATSLEGHPVITFLLLVSWPPLQNWAVSSPRDEREEYLVRQNLPREIMTTKQSSNHPPNNPLVTWGFSNFSQQILCKVWWNSRDEGMIAKSVQMYGMGVVVGTSGWERARWGLRILRTYQLMMWNLKQSSTIVANNKTNTPKRGVWQTRTMSLQQPGSPRNKTTHQK
jgi:hypothetical protein